MVSGHPRCSPTAQAWLFLSPVLVFMALFVVVPVAGTIVNALYRDVSYLPRVFVGMGNFRALLASRTLPAALTFTLLFTVAAVSLQTVLGVSFALLLHERFAGRTLLRTAILVPWALPTIVSGKTWKLIFDYSYGILNHLLLECGIIDQRINWLGTPGGALWSIVAAEVWKTTPFMVIIVLAGLQGLPRDIYQQARIDGAGMVRRLLTITLPLLRPVVAIALVFRTIDSLRIFDLVFVLTGGGPGGSTASLSMLGYEYFSNDRFGMGSAVSLLTFAVAFACTLVYLRLGAVTPNPRE